MIKMFIYNCIVSKLFYILYPNYFYAVKQFLSFTRERAVSYIDSWISEIDTATVLYSFNVPKKWLSLTCLNVLVNYQCNPQMHACIRINRGSYIFHYKHVVMTSRWGILILLSNLRKRKRIKKHLIFFSKILVKWPVD